ELSSRSVGRLLSGWLGVNAILLDRLAVGTDQVDGDRQALHEGMAVGLAQVADIGFDLSGNPRMDGGLELDAAAFFAALLSPVEQFFGQLLEVSLELLEVVGH